MESVKKSIDERAQHKRDYDRWVNERPIQTTEEKVDTSKALDASLVDTKSSGTELEEQYTHNKLGNDAHADDVDIKPYMMKSQWLRHYKELSDSIKTTRAKTIEHTTSLIAQNAEFKTQLQERGFAIAALKNKLRKLTGNITTHYLPKERKPAVVKPPYVIASSNSRISSKNMSRFSSNDMVHNHYLEEAKKKKQKCSKNSEPSLMPSARSQSTANNQNLGATFKHIGIGLHSRIKCVFNANHAHCVTKFLNDVNWRAKVPSNKTTNRNKPVEQISVPNKQKRQIPKGHRFSIKKNSVMQKKTMTPRSCLRWKPTGRIFKTVGLRWVPTGKIFISTTSKVDSKPLNGSNEDITNHNECEQTLDVSAGTLNLSAVQNSEFTTTAMNNPVQSWFQKLFLQQTRQLHYDKSWNYYSTIT
uniref:Integrase, catalytic region, zinc finger, CCHC-type, peptidase aspartic, catalytic n=1 Tax=Tanacetum cinerariifolium TaxID=118510 RepID=A0A6L2JYT8_TANCI|nr:hypothetical protein [Tanacetum cinerariifolium]